MFPKAALFVEIWKEVSLIKSKINEFPEESTHLTLFIVVTVKGITVPISESVSPDLICNATLLVVSST